MKTAAAVAIIAIVLALVIGAYLEMQDLSGANHSYGTGSGWAATSNSTTVSWSNSTTVGAKQSPSGVVNSTSSAGPSSQNWS